MAGLSPSPLQSRNIVFYMGGIWQELTELRRGSETGSMGSIWKTENFHYVRNITLVVFRPHVKQKEIMWLCWGLFQTQLRPPHIRRGWTACRGFNASCRRRGPQIPLSRLTYVSAAQGRTTILDAMCVLCLAGSLWFKGTMFFLSYLASNLWF